MRPHIFDGPRLWALWKGPFQLACHRSYAIFKQDVLYSSTGRKIADYHMKQRRKNRSHGLGCSNRRKNERV